MENEPLKLFHHYWKQAQEKNDPVGDAIGLATVDNRGRPHVRTVLLKTFRYGEIGFVTRAGGKKIDHINHCNDVEFSIFWPTLSLQVRMRCAVEEMDEGLLDLLWSLRARDAKIMYHMGFHQSVIVPSYQFLVGKFKEMQGRWKGEKNIPRAKFYVGYVFHPYEVEFLHQKKSRLNERYLYEKKKESWVKTVLAP